MGLTQKTIVTVKTLDGDTVRVDQSSLVQAIQGTTEDGQKVLIQLDDPDAKADTSVHVEFDDIVEDTKRTLSWDDKNVPDDAWRIVKVVLFDGTQLVFSDPSEAVHFLIQMPSIQSPKEKNAKPKVVAIRKEAIA